MQTSFSELEYAAKKKLTRRDRFLAESRRSRRAALEAEIGPFYPKGEGRAGHRLVCIGCCGCISRSNASDSPTKASRMRSTTARRSAASSALISPASAPDATTLLKFRRLLETNELTRKVFEAINAHLAERGLILREGTIVDATFIAAPPSTKNKAKARDPEMHQAKKGNNWHFGMKAHIGVDAKSAWFMRSLALRPMSATSVRRMRWCMVRNPTCLATPVIRASKRSENQGSTADWHIAMKRGKRKGAAKGCDGKLMERFEAQRPASVRRSSTRFMF